MEDYKSLWWSICPSIPLFAGQVVEIFAKSDLNPITTQDSFIVWKQGSVQ